ncbi:hypothetical protein ACN9MB_13230 [Dyella kyungheensis]|uniref:hypothetical protein n=1 Tax=Dyella kyungheensis TaxID=1242174 RepID=UPI003CEED38A
MAYKNRRLVRLTDSVQLNEYELEKGKQAAELDGKSWGELKRELINAGVQKLLREYGVQTSAASHEV